MDPDGPGFENAGDPKYVNGVLRREESAYKSFVLLHPARETFPES